MHCIRYHRIDVLQYCCHYEHLIIIVSYCEIALYFIHVIWWTRLSAIRLPCSYSDCVLGSELCQNTGDLQLNNVFCVDTDSWLMLLLLCKHTANAQQVMEIQLYCFNISTWLTIKTIYFSIIHKVMQSAGYMWEKKGSKSVRLRKKKEKFFLCCVMMNMLFCFHWHTNTLSHTCRVVSLPAEFVATTLCCAKIVLFEKAWGERTGTSGAVLFPQPLQHGR